MRKIIVISMISMDGVLQAPGGPDEDREGNFEYGGWVAPFGDDVGNKELEKQMQPADYLLGRKTFEIWEDYWPKHSDFWPAINTGMKYVLSNSRDSSEWENTRFIKTTADIEKIKNTDGPDLHVWGSSQLIHLLLDHKLVDNLWLKIHPIILGKGKKLFRESISAQAFTLTECKSTPTGVILASFQKGGDVKTGSLQV